MFRVFLATYLAFFACFLPALHTCDSIVGPASSDGTGHNVAAPHDQHDHHEPGQDDLCIVCRLTEDSGGVMAPSSPVLTDSRTVSDRIDPVPPVLLPSTVLEEIFPRAPPA